MDFSTVMKENMYSSSVILRLKSGTNSSTRRCTAGRTVLQGVKTLKRFKFKWLFGCSDDSSLCFLWPGESNIVFNVKMHLEILCISRLPVDETISLQESTYLPVWYLLFLGKATWNNWAWVKTANTYRWIKRLSP